MRITAHEVLLLQAAVNELIAAGHTNRSNILQEAVGKFATEIRVRVEAGDYWLTKTLTAVDVLDHKLRSATLVHHSQRIEEAA